MRYSVLTIVALCLTFIGAAMSSSQPPQDVEAAHAAAYERWAQAIESDPRLSEAFWLRTDIGPPEMRAAVREILSFGPNMTPFLVKELRRETDPLRLYRLVLLLNAVSGINLYYESGEESIYHAAPRMRDRFIKDWDSQKFQNASHLLRSTWRGGDEDESAERIDPKKLAKIRRFGVFALPFIIEQVEGRNSRELFAAFLIITGKSDLYAQYLEEPSSLFAGREQKLSLMKAWAGENEKKLDKLHGVHERVKALAADPN